METSLTTLQQEIERLNIIISALVQQNIQLKNEILSLKQTADGTDNKDHSSAENPGSVNTVVYSSVKNNEGINHTETSFDKTSDITKQIINSSNKTMEGISNSDNSSTENNKGINQVDHSIPQKNEGIKQVNLVFVQKGLRVVMPTRSHATIGKAAMILTLLYENPRQPHKILMHLTGLSQTGMAKHIMMLKRKGLVVCTAFQTHTLTQLSINIIKDAMR